ncbi:MAG: SUMF1/EgtB/PvdO family nonheme iron enzyme [Rhizobiales bacterium]|nr:SUMF1/EgtB/PvdO family nonheme iron enzyme [Hyphomicrobiales bacterium]
MRWSWVAGLVMSVGVALAGAAGLALGQTSGTAPASSDGAATVPRIALLIGNAGYSGPISKLTNPHNDVALLEATLTGLGFSVEVVRDARLGEITRAVNRHASRLAAAGKGAVGLFYYSGHGAQNPASRTNHLIPVDATTVDSSDLWAETVPLDDITEKLRRQAAAATHFVVFDACRNDLRLTTPDGKSVIGAKGFVPVREVRGMLIAYATAEGEIASDRGEGAGPYARALAEEIAAPGVEAVAMFRRVQLRVQRAIGQEPWLTFAGLGEIYLAGPAEPQAAVAPPAAVPSPNESEAERLWQTHAIETTTDRGLIEAYIAQFEGPAPLWAYRARQRLAALDAAVTPDPPRSELPAAQEAEPTETAALTPPATAPAPALPAPGPDAPSKSWWESLFGTSRPAEPALTSCDEAAARPGSLAARRLGIKGVEFEMLDAASAHTECGIALARYQDAARLKTWLGRVFDKAEQHEEAVRLYTEAAEAGEPIAMVNLGNKYLEGRGVDTDEAAALAWYRKAANAGEPWGMYELGQFYRHRADVQSIRNGVPYAETPAEARRWYVMAANAGLVDAMLKMGNIVPDHEAKDWYRKAADAGSPMGMWQLALLERPELRTLEGGGGLFLAVLAGDPNVLRASESNSWEKEAAAGLQRLLAARGVYSGPIDGVIGPVALAGIKSVFGTGTPTDFTNFPVPAIAAERPSEEPEAAAPVAVAPAADGFEISQKQKEPQAEAALAGRALALAIQVELERLGCAPGAPDGIWGPTSTAALTRYRDLTGTYFEPRPETFILDHLRTVANPVCRDQSPAGAPPANIAPAAPVGGRDAHLTPGSRFRDCPECPEMVVLPAGSYMQGSGTPREITIARPFAVGRYEVTFEEWLACAAAGGCQSNKKPDGFGWGYGRRPVIKISWDEAKEFLAWLSERTSRRCRLLSQGEFEYATRAGTTTRTPHGVLLDKSHANVSRVAGSTSEAGQTFEVGSYPANAFGLHDMLGNVKEWVEDCFQGYAADKDLQLPADGSALGGEACHWRKACGGSWWDGAGDVASHTCGYGRQGSRGSNSTGLRVARDLD